MRIFPAFAAVVLLAVPARAAAPACDPADPDCDWTMTGSESADYLAGHGFDLFRFHVQGFRYPNRLFQVTRASWGGAVLDIHGAGPFRGEMTAPVSAAVWDHLLERWQRFEREEAAFTDQPPKPRKLVDENGHKIETVSVCIDGYSIDFEIAQSGKVARRSPETCGHPLTYALYTELTAYLLAQVPWCARVPEKLREGCSDLEGDRYRAADIVAPLYAFESEEACKPASALDALFAPDVRITQDGKPSTEDGRALRCAAPLQSYDLIEGRPDGSVVVTGSMSYEDERMEAKRIFYSAESTLTWRGGRIVSWDIGPYRRDPD